MGITWFSATDCSEWIKALSILGGLQPLDAKAYMLKVKDNMTEAELDRFIKIWRDMNQQTGDNRVVVCIPDSMDLTPLNTFDFSVALQLLKSGYKVTREYWQNPEGTCDCWLELIGGLIHIFWYHGADYLWDADPVMIMATDYKLKEE